MHIPSREELAVVINELISGVRSREEISNWTFELSTNDSIEIEDEVVADTLDRLSAVDLKSDANSYLYRVDDFRIWLDEVTSETTK
jgi:hypothetical protein